MTSPRNKRKSVRQKVLRAKPLPAPRLRQAGKQVGKKEGGWGEGIFARLLPFPRLRFLVPSREAKQNNFFIFLEEKIWRAQNDNCRENCFVLHRRTRRAEARGLGLLSLKKGSRKVYNYSTKTGLFGIDCSARRVRRAPQGKIRFCFRRKIPEFAPITI